MCTRVRKESAGQNSVTLAVAKAWGAGDEWLLWRVGDSGCKSMGSRVTHVEGQC
jgi:hypothetical protein